MRTSRRRTTGWRTVTERQRRWFRTQAAAAAGGAKGRNVTLSDIPHWPFYSTAVLGWRVQVICAFGHMGYTLFRAHR
jgi:hypothetical protein